MFDRRKILVTTGVFLLILFIIFLAFSGSKGPQLKVTPTILGNNYRLLIEMPHEYIDVKCTYNQAYIQPRLLKISDGVNLYEVLLEALSQGEHSCSLLFERNDGYQTEMTYYFTISGEQL